MSVPRILFAFPVESSFVTTDMALLSSFSQVQPFVFSRKSNYAALLATIAQSDVVVSWFALGYAAFANIAGHLLGKRSIVISGGWDIVSIPEINYGLLAHPWAVVRGRLALKSADLVLAFSDWSRKQIQGFAPGARTRTGYLGVDTAKFKPREKEDLVVSVAIVSRENLVRKGLQEFARASRVMSDVPFMLVGRHTDDAANELRKIGGKNLTLTGWLSEEELQSVLGRARVYAQPSYTEGFGVAVVEAMASGCVPVVTRAGALPEVVGDTGLFVKYGDAEGLATGVRSALTSDRGQSARRRVQERFTLDHRLRTLRAAIEG